MESVSELVTAIENRRGNSEPCDVSFDCLLITNKIRGDLSLVDEDNLDELISDAKQEMVILAQQLRNSLHNHGRTLIAETGASSTAIDTNKILMSSIADLIDFFAIPSSDKHRSNQTSE